MNRFFISFVGVACKEVHGDPALAEIDRQAGVLYAKVAVEEGETPSGKAEELMGQARSFVTLADCQIRVASVGLLDLMPKHGLLNRAKTTHLSNALRPTIPRYKSR